MNSKALRNDLRMRMVNDNVRKPGRWTQITSSSFEPKGKQRENSKSNRSQKKKKLKEILSAFDKPRYFGKVEGESFDARKWIQEWFDLGEKLRVEGYGHWLQTLKVGSLEEREAMDWLNRKKSLDEAVNWFDAFKATCISEKLNDEWGRFNNFVRRELRERFLQDNVMKHAPADSGKTTPATEPEDEGPKGDDGADEPPFVPLTSWAEIFAALNEPHDKACWKNDEATRDKIRKLNHDFDGPIKLPKGKGKQPLVSKAVLKAWWDGLSEAFDARTDEAKAEDDSKIETVGESHPYGRSGTVVPGIDGSIKRTRKK